MSHVFNMLARGTQKKLQSDGEREYADQEAVLAADYHQRCALADAVGQPRPPHPCETFVRCNPTPQQAFRDLLTCLPDDVLLDRAVNTVEKWTRFRDRQARWDLDQIWFELVRRQREDLWPTALARGKAWKRPQQPTNP
jgi:hypothetical protein